MNEVWPQDRRRVIGYMSKGSETIVPQIRSHTMRLQELDIIQFTMSPEDIAREDGTMLTVEQTEYMSDPRCLPKRRGNKDYLRILEPDTIGPIPTIMHRCAQYRPRTRDTEILGTLVRRRLTGDIPQQFATMGRPARP